MGFVINGTKVHTRTIGSMRNGIQSLDWVKKNLDVNATEWIGGIKHRYLYPLDEEMRKQIEPLRKPYPKQCAVSIDSDATDFQPVEGGVIPITALQEK